MTLAISPAQGDLLAALQRADSPRIVVIGATALGHHVKLTRFTADVDLVIVADLEEISQLLEARGWKPDRTEWQRWDCDNSRIDVLPGTARDLERGFVRVENDDREMSLVGFDLALRHASAVPIPNADETVDVASLASLVVLKMVAWLDRPQQRHKDLGDLACAFNGALDDYDATRWEAPLVDLAPDDQSAFFIGVDVAKIASAVHRAKVEEFLELVMTRSWPEVMAREGHLIAEEPGDTARSLLRAFALGLAHAEHSQPGTSRAS
jgi:predicted nucleotidyltransferase